MNKYKIIKELGRGGNGIVYLVIDNYGNKYAMKKEKVNEYTIKSYSSKFWREIKFKKFSKKYPEQFNVLIDYDFQKKKILNKSIIENVRFIYDINDGTFFSIMEHLSKKELYSAIIQITYIASLLSHHGYRHGDFHSCNIMYKNVSKNKTINIYGNDIPTYGYLYCAIDYGSIIHQTYKSYISKSKLYEFENSANDLHKIFKRLLKLPIKKELRRKKIRVNYEKIIEKIKLEPEYEKIKQYINHNYKITQELQIVNLFIAMNEKKFYKLTECDKYIKNIQKYYNGKQLIDKDDFIYMWKHILHPKKIIMYLKSKL